MIILSVEPETHGAEAAKNITRDTGNTKVTVIGLDLSSFASVRTCAAALLKQIKRPVSFVLLSLFFL